MRWMIYLCLGFLMSSAAAAQDWLENLSASCFADPATILSMKKKIGFQNARYLCFLGQSQQIHPETIAFAADNDPIFKKILGKLKKKDKAATTQEFLALFSAKEKKESQTTSLAFPFFSYQQALQEYSQFKVPLLPPEKLALQDTFTYSLLQKESSFFSSFNSFLSPSLFKNFYKLPRNPFPP